MEDTYSEALKSIRNTVDSVPQRCKPQFSLSLKRFADELVEEFCQSNADAVIGSIQDDLRETLPLEAVLPSEEIKPPQHGPNADCEPVNTVHVDSFLYDDDVIDELCEEGKLSRSYCSKCGSKQVLPLNFISHSSSKMQLKYMFQSVLPDLRNKLVLDIGSRTGAVLYAAHFYGLADRIVGVELNKGFCQIQQTMLDKYQLNENIKVVHSDICDQPKLVQDADVIVMNNVFEFFASVDVQERVWQFLREKIVRPGILLVTSPSLEQSLLHLKTGINVDSWVRKIDLTEVQKTASLSMMIEDEEMEDIHLYEVVSQ